MNKLIFFALSGAMLLSSCKSSEVTPQVEEPTTGDYTFTTNSTDFVSGDKISVSAYKDATLSTVVASNVLYTSNGTQFTSQTPIEYTEDVKLTFCATYPYSSQEVTKFDIATDQSTEGYKSSDLMYAKTVQTLDSEPSLDFTHSLSQIILNFEGIDTAPTINAVASVECDMSNNTYSASGNAVAITPNKVEDNIYKAIVSPQKFTKDAVVATITIEGIEYQVVAGREITLASGKAYSFNGNVNEDGVLEFLGTYSSWDVVGGGSSDEPGDTGGGGTVPETENKPVDPECEGVDFVMNMGVGWNLGNTLDAIGGETAWGNPKTTKDMIDKVAQKGFKTLRVPITWHTHLSDDGNYTVTQEWMDRVEEIVNYGLDNDMYVLINIHHDEEIIAPSYAKLEESKVIVRSIWSQVSERFKDYDEKLIFESLNEMRITGSTTEWTGGTDEGRDCINQLHAVSLDAIRSSGGNNATRKVMLSPYAASNNYTAMSALEIPEDDENIIVSIHSYTPYDFCAGTDNNWGTDADKTNLDNMFWEIYSLFVAKDIPVIIGEWGNMVKNPESERTNHAEYYAQAARDHYMCPAVWDDGGDYQIFDRNTLEWKCESMADAIVKAK